MRQPSSNWLFTNLRPEEPLFSYPSVSVRKYLWQRKSRAQKLLVSIFSGIYLILFLGILTHAYLFGWAAIHNFIVGTAILCLFPLILLPVFMYLRLRHRPLLLHRFYNERVLFRADTGKRGRNLIRVIEIGRITFQKISLNGRPVWLGRLHFKSTFFARSVLAFGIEGTANMKDLQAWALDRAIDLTYEETGSST